MVSQLQIAYAQKSGAAGAEPAGEAPQQGAEGPQKEEEGPGPAQSSGRLWVPGQ